MSHHSFESLHLLPSTDLLCTLQSRFCSWFVCRCVRNDMPLDNLTENVKFILTSECTINVIHMHWNDCNDETTTENADGNCTPYYVVFMDCMQLRRGTVHTSHTRSPRQLPPTSERRSSNASCISACLCVGDGADCFDGVPWYVKLFLWLLLNGNQFHFWNLIFYGIIYLIGSRQPLIAHLRIIK